MRRPFYKEMSGTSRTIKGLRELPRFLSTVAARACGLTNYAEISRRAGIPQTSLKRYIALLEALFITEPLPAFSGNIAKRMMKTPKIYFTDTGLLAYLLNATAEKFRSNPEIAGQLIENFVIGEIRKQSAWSRTRISMFHFRTSGDQEVDLVLELPNGEAVGIEIKVSASVGSDAFKGLRVLEDALGKRFKRGVALYAGEKTAAFGRNMFAIPIQRLWRGAA